MASTTFTAKYHGSCAAQCGRMIEPGDEVIYLVDSDLAHVDCTVDAAPYQSEAKAKTSNGRWNSKSCPKCFMVLPLTGRCDDCD